VPFATATTFGWRAALDRTTGAWLGFVGLNNMPLATAGVGVDDVETGSWIIPPSGAAVMPLRGPAALLAEAFGPVGRARVIARVHPANDASLPVAEKTGMRCERVTPGPAGERVHVYAAQRDDDVAAPDEPGGGGREPNRLFDTIVTNTGWGGIMRVSEMMSVRLVTCEPGVSVADASRQMIAANVGSILVCSDQRLVGVLTERDVLRLVAGRRDCEEEPVAAHMTRDVATVAADAPAVVVAELMNRQRIRHLPIVDGATPIGIVSLRDFFAMSGAVLRARGAEAASELLRAATVV
jgi:CBS domain-containing protein